MNLNNGFFAKIIAFLDMNFCPNDHDALFIFAPSKIANNTLVWYRKLY